MLLFLGNWAGRSVSKQSIEETLKDIEGTQKALQKSIEGSKELADQSEKLIKKHRKQVERDADA
jgi:uncharacterized protein YoxC